MTDIVAAVNAEVDGLVYALSHDLGAPLRTIEGFAGLLRDESGALLDPAARDDLDRVLRAAATLRGLLDHLLRFSRSTRQELQLGRVEVGALVDEIVASGATDGVRVEGPGAAEVLADPDLLATALDELLDNAVRAARHGPGPGRVWVTVERSALGTALTVRDDGPGFDERWAEQVFHPLFQLDDSDGQDDRVGIGLAIVRRVAHRHGGRVTVRSRPGEGARFTLDLPGST